MHAENPQWLGRIIEILLMRGLASSSSIKGCTNSEIAEIANGRVLPLRYREFLSAMGRGAGKLYVGTDMFYPAIIGLTEGACDLVSEDPAGIVFPADALAFAM